MKKHTHYHNGSERNFHHDEFSFFQFFSHDGHLFAKHLFSFSRRCVSDAFGLLKISNCWELKKKNFRRDFGIYRRRLNTIKSRETNHSNIWQPSWKISTLRKFKLSAIVRHLIILTLFYVLIICIYLYILREKISNKNSHSSLLKNSNWKNDVSNSKQ